MPGLSKRLARGVAFKTGGQMTAQTSMIEQLEKKAILESMDRANESWLEEARRKVRHFAYRNKTSLLKYGQPNTATSDDVRELMGVENSGCQYANNAMGCVFRDGRWERAGFYASKAEGSHGRLITIWKLKERG